MKNNQSAAILIYATGRRSEADDLCKNVYRILLTQTESSLFFSASIGYQRKVVKKRINFAHLSDSCEVHASYALHCSHAQSEKEKDDTSEEMHTSN